MIVIEEFLPEHLLKEVEHSFKQATMSGQWKKNDFWPERLSASEAPVLICPVNSEISEKILKLLILNKIISPNKKLSFSCMFYRWLPGSFIPWHNDKGWDGALTVYLNKEWSQDWGGSLRWKDKSKTHEIFPHYNSAAINNTASEHCTTASTNQEVERITIQSFWSIIQ